MKRIFENDTFNDQFERSGYITTRLLDSNKMQSLKELAAHLMHDYEESSKNVKADYDLSFFQQNAAAKKLIFDSLWHFFKEPIAKFLPDYEPLIINMFNKKPGTGEVPIHQNWTFVDEDKYTSVSVWIPLCDVSRKNGTLEVVPGTHFGVSKYRSPSIPWVFKGMETVLKEKFMQPLELVEGEVGIIDDSVIHYSGDNFSGKDRPTIQLILKPKKAQALHYLGSEDHASVRIYEVDPDFFMSFNMNDRNINRQLIGEKNISNPKLTEEKLQSITSKLSN